MNADQHSRPRKNGRSTAKNHSEGKASTPGKSDDTVVGEKTELDALKLLIKQFHELREYFSYYVTAKTDGVKLSLRSFWHWIVLASLGFVAVCGLIISANWFVISGSAEGLTLLCGGRSWAGKIIAGVLFLAIPGVCVCYTVARRRIASRERTVRKYEKREARQQAKFGRSVLDQAAASASEKK